MDEGHPLITCPYTNRPLNNESYAI